MTGGRKHIKPKNAGRKTILPARVSEAGHFTDSSSERKRSTAESIFFSCFASVRSMIPSSSAAAILQDCWKASRNISMFRICGCSLHTSLDEERTETPQKPRIQAARTPRTSRAQYPGPRAQ